MGEVDSRKGRCRADAAVARLKATFRSVNELVFGIENVLVIYLGASAVLNGGMSVGMLFAFMAYKMQFVDKAARFVEKFSPSRPPRARPPPLLRGL